MKQISFHTIILLSLLLAAGISSCRKAPIDDHIQGFWMLKEFTTLEDQAPHICERLYYSIGRFVTEVSERQGLNGYGHFVGLTEFKKENNILILKDFKRKNNAQGDSGEKAEIEELLPYGICSPEETVFHIVQCDGKTMTLESNYARLELKKF